MHCHSGGFASRVLSRATLLLLTPIFFIIAFGNLLSISSVAQDDAPFEDLAARAAAARESGATDDAIRLYRAAVEKRADWEEGWWYLGTLLYDGNHFEQATAPFRRVMELDPQLGAAWGFLGLCEFEQGQYREAMDHLQRARALGFAEDPDLQKVALYHLVLLLNASGQFDQSMDLLVPEFGSGRIADPIRVAMGMAALRIPLLPTAMDPSKDALVHEAGEAAAMAAVKDVRALGKFEELARENPDVPYAHYAYGNALASAGLLEKAEQQFREEARVNPNSVLPLNAQATTLLQLKRTSDALAAAQQAVSMAPENAAAHGVLTAVYEAEGKAAEAKAEKAVAQEKAGRPEPIEASQVSRYALHAGPEAQGPESITAKSEGDGDFRAAVQKGEAAQKVGNLAEAEKQYRAALQSRPGWSDGWRRIGELAFMQKKYADAVAALQKTVMADPKQANAWTLMGLSEFELKDYKNARIHLERANAMGFGSNAAGIKFAKYHLALLLNRDGEFNRATDLLIPEAGSPEFAEQVKFAMGLALLRIPLLPEEAKPEQHDLVARAGATAALLAQRHYDQAFARLDALLKEYPGVPFLHYAYGASLADISEFDRAEAQLREELRINPDSALPNLRLASVLVAVHKPEEAAVYAKKALALAPESADAHYLLGRCELETGDATAAVRDLERARDLAPGSPAVHFNLARAYSKTQRSADADRERAEFERLNRLMTQASGGQAQGMSESREAIGDNLSSAPR
jgi:tetratricopeptide (TPR) repeat protein